MESMENMNQFVSLLKKESGLHVWGRITFGKEGVCLLLNSASRCLTAITHVQDQRPPIIPLNSTVHEQQ